MLNRLHTMAFALIVTSAVSLAHADDAPPPSKMQGGTAIELPDPASRDPKTPAVERTTIGDAAALVVTGQDQETRSTLVELTTPAVKSPRYLVKGWVRHEGVAGGGYLEMWSHFGEDAFFTRTLGDRGPMSKLTGDSGWRTFILPFTATPGMSPDRLVVNVVLPGKGKVTVTDVRLVELGDAAPTTTTAPARSEAPVTPLPPPGTPPIERSDTGKRAGILAAAAGAFIAAAALLLALLLRMRQRRLVIAGELRRMRAIDTAI